MSPQGRPKGEYLERSERMVKCPQGRPKGEYLERSERTVK